MPSMIDLFEGRRDAYFDSAKTGLVWADDPDELGWLEAFDLHVERKADIGVYPRRDDGTCKWGCIDVDTGDFSEALRAREALESMSVSSWVATSRSKGWHVWVFAEDWVDSSYMRSLMVRAAAIAVLPDKTEINPKQVTATTKGVGNCVRLPYGEWSQTHPGRCCMVLSPDGEYRNFDSEEFLSLVEPTPLSVIVQIGSEALAQEAQLLAIKRALQQIRASEDNRPRSEGGGGQTQRAYRILHGLDRAEEGERNICAFVISCHLRGSGVAEPHAAGRMEETVRKYFHDGDAFVDEALQVLRGVYAKS